MDCKANKEPESWMCLSSQISSQDVILIERKLKFDLPVNSLATRNCFIFYEDGRTFFQSTVSHWFWGDILWAFTVWLNQRSLINSSLITFQIWFSFVAQAHGENLVVPHVVYSWQQIGAVSVPNCHKLCGVNFWNFSFKMTFKNVSIIQCFESHGHQTLGPRNWLNCFHQNKLFWTCLVQVTCRVHGMWMRKRTR